MNQQTYDVSVISRAEAEEFLRRMRTGPENRSARRSMIVPGGFEITGEYFLKAKDAQSGELEWEHSEKNLITDLGRRCWMDNRWFNAGVNFAPSTEAPNAGRYSMPTDASQVVGSGNLTPGVNGVTHTKVFSTTFGVPGSNRTLGMIALSCFTYNGVRADSGLAGLISYALLTPPKVQLTTQTLEVVYKVSMNPIA